MNLIKREQTRQRVELRTLRNAQAALRERESKAEAKGYRRCKDEHTQLLAPASRENGAPTDAHVIGSVPEVWYYRVALMPRMPMALADVHPRDLYSSVRFVAFEARKKSWTDNMGNIVCWYDWEPRA